jgi:hypothetical protein
MGCSFIFEEPAGIVVPVVGRNVEGTGLKLMARWTKLSARCLVTRARTVSAGNGNLAPRYSEFLRFGRACVESW